MRGEDGGPRAPRTARRLVRWVVGPGEADVVDGELLEGYVERAARAGRLRAHMWYLRQVIGFVLRAPLARGAGGEGEAMGMRAWMGDLRGDLRWAVRGLFKRPTFTGVAVLTLALGIGANSAIFTLVSAHFFTPLPYRQPDRVVLIWETDRNSQEVTTVAPGNYYVWKEQTRSFADIAAYNVDGATVSGDGAAENVPASIVTANFFDVLGVEPALGRAFDAESVREADGRLVIISHSFWIRRYGADPAVIGRDIRVDGRPHTVVGVMPPSFRQPERSLTWQAPELWRPMMLEAQHDDFNSRFLRTVARLAPGATVEEARQEMSLMAERMAEAQPAANQGRTILVPTLDEYLLGDARPTLLLLLAAGAAVLLIVCANVANLTLARGEERLREFAVRAALGSGSRRLLRQLGVEAVVLALVGAAVGVAAVYAGRGVLQRVQERFFSGLVEARVDPTVVGLTVALAIVAGVVFGLPQALTAARADLRGALTEGSQRAGGSAATRVTRNLLIVGQVGLATTLLIVAALLSRSFLELMSVPPGFETEGRLTFEVTAPSTTYPDRDALEVYFRDLWREVEAVPGVVEVGMVSDMPFTTENRWTPFGLEGVPYDEPTAPSTEIHTVLPGYFDVMGIPVLAGDVSGLGWEPVEGEIPVAVNDRLAGVVAPEGSPLGRAIKLYWGDEPTTLRIAAVVGDILDDGFAAVPEPAYFQPFGAGAQRRMSVVVRAQGDLSAVSAGLRDAVARVDPDIPAGGLQLLDRMLAETVARPQAASLIGGAFAVLALLVAAAGIYGVLSYAVQRRTREMGIRAALGASASQIVSMVMGQATRLLGLGLLLGILGAWLAGSALSGLLFGVSRWDPVSFLAAVTALGGVGALAAWLPARRAVRVDPTDALRAE